MSFRFGPSVLAAEGDRDDLVGLFADDSRWARRRRPVAPPGDLPVVLARASSDAATVVRRLDPDRWRSPWDRRGHASGESVVLVPFADIHDSRYTLYFPLAEPQRLQERRARAARGRRRQRSRCASNRDTVAAGEQQPESDHRFEGQDTWSGLTDGRRGGPPPGGGPTA